MPYNFRKLGKMDHGKRQHIELPDDNVHTIYLRVDQGEKGAREINKIVSARSFTKSKSSLGYCH